jgi:hypothetical protein
MDPRTKPYRLRAAVVVLGLALATAVQYAPAADAAPKWAAASKATITPGIQLITAGGGQCTGNFVFYDAKNVYIGQAGHCSSLGLPNETNGCTTKVLPAGAKVEIEGATKPGVIVYNSWVTMQKIRERDENTCFGNDFALVRLDPADKKRVNPTIPFWGGPTGIAKSVGTGDIVYAYGDSSLRAGTDALSPRFGIASEDELGGWTHGAYDVPPGIFGDSGSPVLASNGAALGVFTTISLVLPPLQHNSVDVTKLMTYMKKKNPALAGLVLAKGTEPFAPLF